ncbi:hypothetical protein EZV62_025961 [Acer yangbiense]|uniref:Uncharacterized protein n=1 Tax=Acer yangbiense TaxID=1000413 RepID=A0A5C7H1C4_9ROSI|nr:hypothetical protein EZV62_025961 [Acer yangbiense]
MQAATRSQAPLPSQQEPINLGYDCEDEKELEAALSSLDMFPMLKFAIRFIDYDEGFLEKLRISNPFSKSNGFDLIHTRGR